MAHCGRLLVSSKEPVHSRELCGKSATKQRVTEIRVTSILKLDRNGKQNGVQPEVQEVARRIDLPIAEPAFRRGLC